MNIKLAANKLFFKLKNSSPTIMLVTGIIGFGGACYLSSKATLKVDEILDESREKVKCIHEVRNNPENAGIYSEQNMQHDLANVYGKTAWQLCKLYSPAFITFIVSSCLTFGSHHIMTKRVIGLGTVVGALTTALNKQNARVNELYGEEKATDIWLGTENQKVEATVINEETGEETKKKVTAKIVNEENIVSPYAFVFDENNPNYIIGDPQHNVDQLLHTESLLYRKLVAQGYLFLNEFRDAYGMKPIPEGQIIGWIYDEKDENRHNTIECGIAYKLRPDVRDFRTGVSKTFVIDPNVDGIIVEDFFKFDKSNKTY